MPIYSAIIPNIRKSNPNKNRIIVSKVPKPGNGTPKVKKTNVVTASVKNDVTLRITPIKDINLRGIKECAKIARTPSPITFQE
jgi:hypothetical protein